MTYTIDDVKHIIPEELTANQIAGVEAYLNHGTVPAADPCGSCDPNLIRKLIARVKDGGGPKLKIVDEAPAGSVDINLDDAKTVILSGSRDDVPEKLKGSKAK